MREEETTKLKKKINLQHELIKKQDQYHEALEEERKEREMKVSAGFN